MKRTGLFYLLLLLVVAMLSLVGCGGGKTTAAPAVSLRPIARRELLRIL